MANTFESLKKEYLKYEEKFENHIGMEDEYSLREKVNKMAKKILRLMDFKNREQVLFALKHPNIKIEWEYSAIDDPSKQFKNIPQNFYNDFELLDEAIDHDLDQNLEFDQDINKMKQLIERDIKFWRYAGKDIKDNDECVMAGLKHGNPFIMKSASDRLKASPEFALNVIRNIESKDEDYMIKRRDMLADLPKKNGIFPYLRENVRNMEKVILEAAKVHGKSIIFETNKKWRENPEFMKKFNEALKEREERIAKKHSVENRTYDNKLNGYQGIFLNEETQKKLVQLQENGLSDIVNDMHITFNFGELYKFPDELMNKEIALKLIGYASDGKNSGFQVELPEELKSYYKNKNGAHITVSLGEVDGVKGKAVDTGTMNFEEIDPVEISGKLGYFVFREDRTKSGKVMDNSLFEEQSKGTSEHSAKEISEGITPREGEIEEVLDETIVEQDRINNPEQEKKGQTQGDN